jgi:hypothetical protein
VVEDGEDPQAMAATFARAGGEVDPAATVSRVENRYLDLSRGQVFDATERNTLKGATQEKLEGGVLDDVGVHTERNIPDL